MRFVVGLSLGTGALAQVCRAPAAFGSAGSCGGQVDMPVPFAAVALWASSLVPADCDRQEGQCNWAGAADAWRYALNSARLALEGEGADADQELISALKQLQEFMAQMGHHPGIWYGNWHQAAGAARAVIEQSRSWLSKKGSQSIVLPKTDIGTHFPGPGRSVSIPTDGDRGTTVTLANGYAMPILGFGVWQLPADGTTYRSVMTALELGYRHIDTAQGYGNEHEVGRAMRDSGLPRSQICLVTKLSNSGEYGVARQRFEQQLNLLGVDYIDIYMLHSPGAGPEDRKKAWQQMEQLYDEGKIKALGVSNFDVQLLQELLGFARIRPVYIQNKYSIYQPGDGDEVLRDASLMEWLAREKIVMTGYSIIHPAHGGYLSPLDDPIVNAIANRHSRAPSQVLHRWLLQLGAAVIPRSTKRARIQENGDLFTFALPETDMRLLNGIAAMLKADPGKKSEKAFAWCDDVYGLRNL